MQQPISVSERLPPLIREDSVGQQSDLVLAYNNDPIQPGWCIAYYGAALFYTTHRWTLDTSLISGPEWKADELWYVTHWMPLPPAPSEGA